MNQRLALDALIKAHTLTASELMEHTGLSRVTAHAVCDDLKDMGWVRELPPSLPASSAGIGRPARTYAFDALAGLVVGIDLGVSTITGQLCDLRGQLLAEAVSTTSRHDRPGAELALDAMTLLNDLLSRRPPESGRILAIALGVPAPVNREGRITQPNIVVPGLQDLDLPTIFRRDDCQVIVENDANLAVLAERWRGAAQGADNVVTILSGERLGSGIIAGGHLLHGHDGEAGELDFLGLVQDVGDTRGAARVARELGQQAVAEYLGSDTWNTDAPGALIARYAGTPADVEARHVMDAARDGDLTGQTIVRAVAQRMARTVAVISTLLNPDIVIIGGAIATAGDTLLDPLKEAIVPLTKRTPTLAASTLGDHAVSLGAIRHALNLTLPTLVT
jgi:predicted NBD/HSP70 family sugar kinase